MKDRAITRVEADEYFSQILNKFAEEVSKEVEGIKLTENQFGALVSFAYNVGMNQFKSSTLLRLLKQGNYSGAANEFPRWNKGGGRVWPGLTRRRAAERELFLN